MPGYGIAPAQQGSGLLAWPAAAEALAAARNYWLATTWVGGGPPHLMPVWAVWHDGALWFSSSLGSRKIRNLSADPRCTVSTENADNPVVVSGRARIVTDLDRIAAFLGESNRKYEVSYDLDFLDPTVNATVRIEPEWAFALKHGDFTGSPTRWRFAKDQVG
jgi:nitroimidazol reductase NimA-like FMN-containing flavoprotein (pyridoxamine 5'-phosphate oxidase superfamily)